MPNTNCLENLKCPKCSHDESFLITATTVVTVTDDGAQDHGAFSWEDNSPMDCPNCQFEGMVEDFRTDLERPPIADIPALLNDIIPF